MMIGFQIRAILAIIDLQVTPILPVKFRVNWRCSSKFRINFQSGGSGGHFGNLIGTILCFFLSTKHPDTSYRVSSQLAFSS